ncbi:myb-like protein X isoform X2 [Danio aesculapii]|uniref:myb-like protein X isoform X2 n=1 Tax=Danio aesculapii TaxID=1142201 RepID=UPI0024BF76D5|nr:myb-like protein X isoform X2 [Danio aesculapii]
MDQNIADFLTDAFSESNFEHLHFDEDIAMAHSVDVSEDTPDIEDDENSNRESSESDSEEDDDTAAANNINTPQNAADMEDDDNNRNQESRESESEVDLESKNREHLHSDDDTTTEHSINRPQNAPDMKDDNNSNQESSESECEVDLESKNREHLHSDDKTRAANNVNTPQKAPDMEDDNNCNQESSELDSESDLEFEKREHLHTDYDTEAANNLKSPQNAPDMEDDNNSDQESRESDSEVDLESKNREHLHSDDDTTTEHSINTPQNAPDMKDDERNNREYSGTEFDLDLECKNREEEIKNRSENNSNFSLDEQCMKPGSTLGGSWDDSNSDENKTPTQDQQLSLRDKGCRNDGFDDIHQAEDDNVQKMALQKGTLLDLDTMSSHKETTSHLLSYQMVDEHENESSASEENTVEQKSTEDQDLKLYCLSSTLQDCVESMDGQSGDELKEFTEDDLEREEEGLAEFPSDLSRSDSGDSGEGQTMDTKLDDGLGWSGEMKKMEELTLSYQAVTLRKEAEDVSVDHADVLAFVKNEDLYKTTTSRKSDDILFQAKQDSFRDDDYSSVILNAGESSDFEIAEMVQFSSNDSYKKEQPEYVGDISSDVDYCKIQDEKPDLPFQTDKNKPTLLKQEHTFIEDFPTDVELEVGDVLVTDSQNPERCDVISSSIHPGSKKEGSPERHSTETSSSKLDSSEASKPKDNSEDITVLLPGTFWSVMDEDNLKFDEYDWDINGEEVLCDEEDSLLEDLENEDEGSERDWEKEKERIKAFNKYYDTVEGEENRDRSHLVTFCLEPKYSLYEEESDSEEDLNTKCCMYEPHPSESSSFQNQSNNDNNKQVSDTLENISGLLKDEDNVMLDEYDYGIGEEDFYKTDSRKTILDDEDDFLEKLKMEIEREMQQERTEALNKFYEESGKEKHEVTDRSQKGLYGLRQDSQNEEDNESSEQESYTEDDTSSALRIKDQSDSDEPHERRLYTGRHKVLIKGLQKADKQLNEPPRRSKCVFLLRSVFALSLVTVVGLLSYCWATDNMDLLNTDGSSIFNMIQNRQ